LFCIGNFQDKLNRCLDVKTLLAKKDPNSFDGMQNKRPLTSSREVLKVGFVNSLKPGMYANVKVIQKSTQ